MLMSLEYKLMICSRVGVLPAVNKFIVIGVVGAGFNWWEAWGEIKIEGFGGRPPFGGRPNAK